MSKTFIAVDKAGNRRLYTGNRLPVWWIRLSLRLHGWTAEPLVRMGISPRPVGDITRAVTQSPRER